MQNNFWQKLNKPILALAPMAGITDSAFRQICREHGADVVYSEMASVSALFFKPQKTLELIKFNKKERPYVVQLFGKNPEHFAKAAQILSSLPLKKGDARPARNASHSETGGRTEGFLSPDGIDINFGCPAKKVFGHGSGCALMLDIDLSREIIKAVCDNTDLPVSIKIRAGVNYPRAELSDSESSALGVSAIAFINGIKDLPFSAVMIHCRTYEQGFAGIPDYALAEKIKKIIPDKVVLVNGGINSPEDGVKILRKYPNIDGLGMARGTMGRPWIFEEIKSLISAGEGFIEKKYTFDFIKKIAIAHAKLLYKNKGQRGMFEIRKHLVWYFKGFPGASELRKKLVQVKSIEEIKKILKQ